MPGRTPTTPPVDAGPAAQIMSRIQQVAPATARPSVLGWILIWMVVVGALFATAGLGLFEKAFTVEQRFEGRAAASLFLCGASLVAFLLSLYRYFFTGTTRLNLTVPRNVNTLLSFGLAMFIGWLVGTTVFR